MGGKHLSIYRFRIHLLFIAASVGLLLSACAPQLIEQPTVLSSGSPLPSLTGIPATGLPPANPASTPIPTNPVLPSPTTKATPLLPGETPDTYQWKQIGSGLTSPVDMADPGDGSGRLLIVEKPGLIQILQNGVLLAEPFLDITDRVLSSGTEQGLLGIALHPQYKSNGFFYVNYIDVDGNTVIARFKVTSNLNVADKNSEKILLHVRQPFPNHNGGSMVFGPDGYLYMGLGDGGSQGDPHLNGQNTNVFLGKILRVDVDHGDPYAIPKDNPFVNGGGLPEIWAYGLRNPWRFSFDRQTGDLYIADVGQDLYEEIDFLPAHSPGGSNFGWSFREGFHPYKGNPPAGAKFVDPVWEYTHDQGCSITGGFVYRGKALPKLAGVYFYGDYCSGNIWGLQKGANGKWQSSLLFQSGRSISSFGQDQAGELYLLDLNGGGIYQLQ
jgi:glucose/arabinose dehydrogenase